MFYVKINCMMDRESFEDLDDAIKYANNQACYIQEDIVIYNSKEETCENEVMRRRWYGVPFDSDLYEDGGDADIIDFGDFGYYAEWE